MGMKFCKGGKGGWGGEKGRVKTESAPWSSQMLLSGGREWVSLDDQMSGKS